MKAHLVASLFFMLLMWGTFQYASAATPSLLLQHNTRGGVAVLLATKGTSVNVVEGSLRVKGDVSIDTAASVVGMWVEAPVLQDGVIRFAGVIPGGFSGMVLPGEGKVGAGELFSLRSETGARVTLEGGTVYLHDGVGTAITITTQAEERIEPTRTSGNDAQPPRITSIEVTDGVHTDMIPQVMVTAVDKETGVNNIQIRYGEGMWQSVSMPHTLDPQLLKERVDVRVFDGAGNYVQQSVASSTSPFLRSMQLGYVIVGGLGLLALLLVAVRIRRRT
jgi:hypothetical protein